MTKVNRALPPEPSQELIGSPGICSLRCVTTRMPLQEQSLN
jgi:hypothetical protein